MRIIIRLSEGLDLANSADKLMDSKCLQNNSTATHVVQLRATKIGSMTVTVLAEVDNRFPEECGPETIISKRYEHWTWDSVKIKTLFLGILL